MAEVRAAIDELPAWVVDLAVVIVIILCVQVLMALVNAMLSRAMRRRVGRYEPGSTGDLERAKRNETVTAMLASLVRYAGWALILTLSVFVLFEGAASALFGASLMVIVVGFGVQRILNDVVAGGMLLFEGDYSVGDFVKLENPEVAGRVEEFGLRSTVLRTLGGDRVVINNSSMLVFSTLATGYRSYRVAVPVRAASADELASVRQALESATDMLAAAPGARYLVPPRVDGERTGGGDVTWIELRATVPPTQESLVEVALVGVARDAAADQLAGPVITTDLSDRAFDEYRSKVIVRESVS